LCSPAAAAAAAAVAATEEGDEEGEEAPGGAAVGRYRPSRATKLRRRWMPCRRMES
jgi:hypothetical protein